MGIVADAALVESERSAAKLEGVDTGHTQVDGFGLDVQAVFRDTGSALAEELVSPRRTIAANDVDFSVRMAHGDGELFEDVVEAWVEVADVAGAKIAEEVVEFGDGVRKIFIAAAVNDVDALAGVGVEKDQAMLLRLGDVCGLRGRDGVRLRAKTRRRQQR